MEQSTRSTLRKNKGILHQGLYAQFCSPAESINFSITNRTQIRHKKARTTRDTVDS